MMRVLITAVVLIATVSVARAAPWWMPDPLPELPEDVIIECPECGDCGECPTCDICEVCPECPKHQTCEEPDFINWRDLSPMYRVVSPGSEYVASCMTWMLTHDIVCGRMIMR